MIKVFVEPSDEEITSLLNTVLVAVSGNNALTIIPALANALVATIVSLRQDHAEARLDVNAICRDMKRWTKNTELMESLRLLGCCTDKPVIALTNQVH
jgi:hypothetical protein